MNTEGLPDVCKPGMHKPAIVHRCGGKDARYHNRCGVCGREIENDGTSPDRPYWATAEQVDAYAEELRQEAEYEAMTEYYNTAEARCPPRE
jgi:hypothetical protein